MSGTFPSSPVASNVRLRSVQPTLVSQAQSLVRWARTRSVQRWGAVLTFPTMTRAQFMPIWAFCVAQKGQYGTFQIVLPGHDTPQGTWPGSPVVDGGSQVGNTLLVKGLTAGQTGIAKAGDLFKVAGHTKVYMVTADANSDGSGKASLSIEPKLVTSPANNEALTTTSVPITMALAQDTNEYPVRPPVLFNFEVSLIEVY